MPSKKIKDKYYRKQVDFFILVEKIKLWPSKSGLIHGIKEFDVKGPFAQITTHCNLSFTIRHSKRSRAARWLRNKWFSGVCPDCGVPRWKLEKYAATHFRRHYGSLLLSDD